MDYNVEEKSSNPELLDYIEEHGGILESRSFKITFFCGCNGTLLCLQT